MFEEVFREASGKLLVYLREDSSHGLQPEHPGAVVLRVEEDELDVPVALLGAVAVEV